MARSPASRGSGEKPQGLACPQLNRLCDCGRERSPSPHSTQSHTGGSLPENARLPVHLRWSRHHSPKVPSPSEPQVPGKCGTKSGSVERKGQGWCKVKGHKAGEWRAISPGGKGHWTNPGGGMDAEMKIQMTQGARGRRRGQRSPWPPSSSLQVWRPEMDPSASRRL